MVCLYYIKYNFEVITVLIGDIMKNEQLGLIKPDYEQGPEEWDFDDLYQKIKSAEDYELEQRRSRSHLSIMKEAEASGLIGSSRTGVPCNAFNTVTLADERYGFGLDNYWLGVSTIDDDINIYYTGGKNGSILYEVNIRISSDDVAEKVTKDLGTKETTTEIYGPI